MYVCMHVCMHVCACNFECKHVGMHGCMHVCMHVCMYVCRFLHTGMYVHQPNGLCACLQRIAVALCTHLVIEDANGKRITHTISLDLLILVLLIFVRWAIY